MFLLFVSSLSFFLHLVLFLCVTHCSFLTTLLSAASLLTAAVTPRNPRLLTILSRQNVRNCECGRVQGRSTINWAEEKFGRKNEKNVQMCCGDEARKLTWFWRYWTVLRTYAGWTSWMRRLDFSWEFYGISSTCCGSISFLRLEICIKKLMDEQYSRVMLGLMLCSCRIFKLSIFWNRFVFENSKLCFSWLGAVKAWIRGC